MKSTEVTLYEDVFNKGGKVTFKVIDANTTEVVDQDGEVKRVFVKNARAQYKALRRKGWMTEQEAIDAEGAISDKAAEEAAEKALEDAGWRSHLEDEMAERRAAWIGF